MIAGLPGTGIGGLFHLVLALWLPVRQAGLLIARRTQRVAWGVVGRQVAMSTAILAVLWFEAWAIYELAALVGARGALAEASIHASAGQLADASRAASVATFASLAVVLFGVVLLRLFAARPQRGPRCGVRAA